jgi:hypothetical protein
MAANPGPMPGINDLVASIERWHPDVPDSCLAGDNERAWPQAGKT